MSRPRCFPLAGLSLLMIVTACGQHDDEATGPVATDSPTSSSDTAALHEAAADYAGYVRAQVAQQVAATRTLTNAVRSGNLALAVRAYPAARVNYERIEPVAESFGSIDPDLDARINDVPSVAAWTGYHRLEQALFAKRSLKGMVPIANKLDADVARLDVLVKGTTFQPAELANGATQLLDEVGKTKITGEEERYSHLDLVDFQANIDGAKAAYVLLEPVLVTRQAVLAKRITTAFTAVDAALDAYRTGPGPTDFKLYAAVPVGQHRVLAGLVDSLAEPLSQVAAEITA